MYLTRCLDESDDVWGKYLNAEWVHTSVKNFLSSLKLRSSLLVIILTIDLQWTIYTCDWCQRWLLLFWHFVAPLFHLYTHYFYFGGVYCWDCCWWELCQTTKSTSLYNVYTFSEVFVNGKDLSNNKSHLFLQYIHIFRGAYCWVTICEDPKIITATSVDNLIYT